MSKYYGSWSTNNGNTFNGNPWKSNNLRQMRKDLRDACNGNLTGPTDMGRWRITDKDGNDLTSGICRW